MASTRTVCALTRSVVVEQPPPSRVRIASSLRKGCVSSLRHTRLASSSSSSTTRVLPSSHLPTKEYLHSSSLSSFMPRLRQPKRHFTTTLVARKDDSSSQSSSEPQSRLYTFSEIQSLTTNPDPNRIIVDVREPGEVQSTGKIPGSRNVPVSSAPDAFFLPAEEFEERYGFEKPGKDAEAIFYCKAGVRSRAAARLAAQGGFAGKIGEFPGSWIEWEKSGGEIEREK